MRCMVCWGKGCGRGEASPVLLCSMWGGRYACHGYCGLVLAQCAVTAAFLLPGPRWWVTALIMWLENVERNHELVRRGIHWHMGALHDVWSATRLLIFMISTIRLLSRTPISALVLEFETVSFFSETHPAVQRASVCRDPKAHVCPPPTVGAQQHRPMSYCTLKNCTRIIFLSFLFFPHTTCFCCFCPIEEAALEHTDKVPWYKQKKGAILEQAMIVAAWKPNPKPVGFIALEVHWCCHHHHHPW